jgi:hypothetical protein
MKKLGQPIGLSIGPRYKHRGTPLDSLGVQSIAALPKYLNSVIFGACS